MPRPRPRTVLLSLALLIVVGLAVLAGFRLSPKGREARHLSQGDRYFSQQQYREAVFEYLNVLQVEATNARALRQLGLSHYKLGELGPAHHYLVKFQEIAPE